MFDNYDTKLEENKLFENINSLNKLIRQLRLLSSFDYDTCFDLAIFLIFKK